MKRIRLNRNVEPVGYGRPPKKHQFKPGQSGNPRGRPKGAMSTDALVRKILDGKLDLRIGGAARKVSVREAILTRFTEFALKGNPKAAAFLLHRYDSAAAQPGDDVGTDREMHDTIDFYVKRYLQRTSNDNGKS
jgi:hypothetical protein